MNRDEFSPAELERCTRCNELLSPEREVWLELDTRTGRYCEDGSVPEEHSQGAFPFGPDCADAMLAERGTP